MKKLLALLIILHSALVGQAQLRTGAGYDCEEEIFPRYDKATRTYGYVNMVGIWRVDPAFTKAERFSGKLAVVQRGTKFGLLNCQGQLAANTIYDEILNFVNGRGWARQGALWGLLDDKGRLVVPPAFEDIRPVTPRSELTWVKKKGVWGIFSKDRIKMVVEPKYDACRSISDSLGLGLRGGYVSPIYLGTGQIIYDSCAFFTKAGGKTYRFSYRNKEGLMEATGTVLMRPEYEKIEDYANYILAKKDEKWAVGTMLGKLTTALEYDELLGSDGVLIAARKGKKWGYLLPTGKTFLPFDYDGALAEHAQYYAVKKVEGPNKPWALNKVSDKLTDSDFQYEKINFSFHPKLAIVGVNGNMSSAIDLKTGNRYPYEFTSFGRADLDSGNHIWVSTGEFGDSSIDGLIDVNHFEKSLPMRKGSFPLYIGYGLIGLNEKSGRGAYRLSTQKFVIAPEYSSVWILYGTNTVSAMKGQTTSIFSLQGKKLYDINANQVKYYKQNLYLFQKDKKWGLVQAPENWILKAQFDTIVLSGTLQECGGLPLITYRKNKAQLYSYNGKDISASYDSIRYIGQGFFSAKTGATYVVLERTGKEAAPNHYERITTFSEGLCLVVEVGHFAYLNRSLKPAFTLPLQSAEPFNNGTGRVRLNGKQVLINKAGKTVQVLP